MKIDLNPVPTAIAVTNTGTEITAVYMYVYCGSYMHFKVDKQSVW